MQLAHYELTSAVTNNRQIEEHHSGNFKNQTHHELTSEATKIDRIHFE